MKEQKIALVLRDVGVASNLQGFEYLKECILMACDGNKKMMNLYTKVGAMHAKSAHSIERACRYAITECWPCFNHEVYGLILGGYVGVPTVKHFVTGVANYVMYYCREVENNV